jgi:head-tail adaptor
MPHYPPPNPGAYNRRIRIQQEAPVTVGTYGTARPAWATVIQAWASLVPKTYQARTQENQPMVVRQAQYKMRRIPSVPITGGMRVVDTTEADATQTWTILDVQDVLGMRRELLLVCQLVLPDQGV